MFISTTDEATVCNYQLATQMKETADKSRKIV